MSSASIERYDHEYFERERGRIKMRIASTLFSTQSFRHTSRAKKIAALASELVELEGAAEFERKRILELHIQGGSA